MPASASLASSILNSRDDEVKVEWINKNALRKVFGDASKIETEL